MRRLVYWSVGFGLGLVVLTCLEVAAVRFINPPFTALMLRDRFFSEARVEFGLDWVPAAKISPHLVRAVLAAEDQRFYDHRGFDWAEIRIAVTAGRQGRPLRGASTITQQTARTLFLWPGRSWVRKALEAYYTVLLELFLPKNRILEVYLNTAEWGLGLYGAPAAAKKYFGRSAARLTADQAAGLAVILPAPKKRSPLKPTRGTAARKESVLKQMPLIRLPDWPNRR